jgi:hypothetical protein
MERLPSFPLDLDATGILVANFLQAWRQAGLPSPVPPSSRETAHDLENPSPSPAKDGLCLPAAIHDGPSPSPSEHEPSVCLKGPSPGTGLAPRLDPGPGRGLGTLGHPDEHPAGFQDGRGRCVPGESGGGLRLGGLALISFVQRLASLAGDLRLDRDPHHRRRRVLRSGRFQRSVGTGRPHSSRFGGSRAATRVSAPEPPGKSRNCSRDTPADAGPA